MFSWHVNGKKRQKGNSFVNSQSIIDRHNSNFCFFLSNIIILHHINIMFDSSMQRYLVTVWQTRKKPISRLIPLQFEAYFLCTHSSRYLTDHFGILTFYFRKGGRPPCRVSRQVSILVIFILFLSHYPRSAISLPFFIGSLSYLASW